MLHFLLPLLSQEPEIELVCDGLYRLRLLNGMSLQSSAMSTCDHLHAYHIICFEKREILDTGVKF